MKNLEAIVIGGISLCAIVYVRRRGERVVQVNMSEKNLPLDDLGDLAEAEISERREEVHDESQARELLDVPSKDAAQVAQQQSEDEPDQR